MSTRRNARTTVLIVGEGHTEVEFLRHIRQALLADGRSLALTIKNAKGKGGHHVLNEAIALMRRATYDRVAVMVDTDVGWSDKERLLAQNKGVVALESTPCIEATLLKITGRSAPEYSKACKAMFESALRRPAHDPRVYSHADFAAPALRVAAQASEPMRALFQLLGL